MMVHDGAVTCMRLSADGKYFFTAGQDGNIFIFLINDMNRAYLKNDFQL